MDDLWRTAAWVAVAGAAGGALNAAFSDNAHLLPSRIVINMRTRVVRPGLCLSAVAGLLASLATLRALAGPGCMPRADSPASLVPIVAVALLIGAGAARYLSNAADKRLLRAAISRAAAAPAAHPDAVAAMERATPHELFEAATRLLPQHRRLR